MNTTAAAVNKSTANTNKQQTAKEVIASNVQALIEQLEQGHSEALTAYLTAMGRFHTYSFGNILEIARQKPDATRVAGLYAWNQLGRKIKKGERGIRILAPMIGIRRKKDEEAEKDIRTQNQAVLVGFRAAYVFERLSRDLRSGSLRVRWSACGTPHRACDGSHMITYLIILCNKSPQWAPSAARRNLRSPWAGCSQWE
jgi:N-terminal domain of anti-restriction factor ArdC